MSFFGFCCSKAQMSMARFQTPRKLEKFHIRCRLTNSWLEDPLVETYLPGKMGIFQLARLVLSEMYLKVIG